MNAITIRNGKTSSLLALSVTLLVACLSGPLAKAQLFYEGFDRPATGGVETLPTYSSNWHAVKGVTGGLVTDITSATSGEYFGVSDANGNPNSTPGFLIGGSNAGSTTYYAAYTTLASSLTIPTGTSITWTMGNNSTAPGVRLLVQSGGNWYTTGGAWYQNTSAFSSDANFAAATTSSITYNYTFATTGWRAVTLTPGGNFTLEAQPGTSTLPSNQITAIGFFMYGSSGNVFRLDSLTVVPEPSSFALFGLGMGALGLARLRRKS